MLELGWLEGRDYTIDARHANGVPQAGADLAAQLVASQPSLLLTTADTATRLLVQRTKTIPIVFTLAQDPVGNGNVASLQQPGGNATGLMSLAQDLSAKRLQLLKEGFPAVTHVAVFFQPDNAGGLKEAKEIEAAGRRLGMRISRIEVRQRVDIEPALKRVAELHAQACIVTQGYVLINQQRVIAERLVQLKIPAIAATTEYVEAGGLMSYAASSRDNFRRAATYVDKIFKGANPATLPVEQPTQFELIVNLKVAKAAGLTFPQSFLVRADRVID